MMLICTCYQGGVIQTKSASECSLLQKTDACAFQRFSVIGSCRVVMPVTGRAFDYMFRVHLEIPTAGQ